MGFKDVMKKIGKGALKVAPYAALAIPGVGPIASMAIAAGANAADKKLSGGSWKDALLSGGIGAGASYLGGKIPGLDKGLSPSTDFVKGEVGKVAAKAAGGGGFKSALGNVAKKVGESALGNVTGIRGYPGTTGINGPLGGQQRGWQDVLGDVLGRVGTDYLSNRGEPNLGNRGNLPDYVMNARSGGRTDLMRGLGPVMGQYDQTFPNLAESIGAGRQDSIRNQPWRRGYEVVTQTGEEDDEGNPTTTSMWMPRIYPTGSRRGNSWNSVAPERTRVPSSGGGRARARG